MFPKQQNIKLYLHKGKKKKRQFLKKNKNTRKVYKYMCPKINVITFLGEKTQKSIQIYMPKNQCHNILMLVI